MREIIFFGYFFIFFVSCVEESQVSFESHDEKIMGNTNPDQNDEISNNSGNSGERFSLSTSLEDLQVNEGERKDINIEILTNDNSGVLVTAHDLPSFVKFNMIDSYNFELKIFPQYHDASEVEFDLEIRDAFNNAEWKKVKINIAETEQIANFGFAGGTQIYRYDITKMDQIIKPTAIVEKVYEDVANAFLSYTEGPLWLPEQQKWIFTDSSSNRNRIFEWSESSGFGVWLEYAGYNLGHAGVSSAGANGIVLNNLGELLICRQGAREIAKLNASLDNPSPNYITLTNSEGGSKFNSPNDITVHSNGNIYFTDPDYGLPNPKGDYNEYGSEGIFLLKPNGETVLLDNSIIKPNGLGVNIAGDKLIVASSDGNNGRLYTYDILADGTINNQQVLFDPASAGLPEIVLGGFDGLEISKAGHIFATGSSGVLILEENGSLIGYIELPNRPSNIAFNSDDSEILLTVVRSLYRVILK